MRSGRPRNVTSITRVKWKPEAALFNPSRCPPRRPHCHTVETEMRGIGKLELWGLDFMLLVQSTIPWKPNYLDHSFSDPYNNLHCISEPTFQWKMLSEQEPGDDSSMNALSVIHLKQEEGGFPSTGTRSLSMVTQGPHHRQVPEPSRGPSHNPNPSLTT